MSGVHSDLGPELRALAQTILDRLDPAVRLAAARATGGAVGPCQQVWCPVCALAAFIGGESHPLLTVVAEHSVSLLAVVRAAIDQLDQTGQQATPSAPAAAEPAADSGSPAPPEEDRPRPAPGRYQRIDVTIDE